MIFWMSYTVILCTLKSFYLFPHRFTNPGTRYGQKVRRSESRTTGEKSKEYRKKKIWDFLPTKKQQHLKLERFTFSSKSPKKGYNPNKGGASGQFEFQRLGRGMKHLSFTINSFFLNSQYRTREARAKLAMRRRLGKRGLNKRNCRLVEFDHSLFLSLFLSRAE